MKEFVVTVKEYDIDENGKRTLVNKTKDSKRVSNRSLTSSAFYGPMFFKNEIIRDLIDSVRRKFENQGIGG